MNWKSIFGFNWIKLIISIVIVFLAYEFRTLGMKIGGSQPIQSYIMPIILVLSLIYLIAISIVGIISKINS
jgi:hypothetical protein